MIRSDLMLNPRVPGKNYINFFHWTLGLVLEFQVKVELAGGQQFDRRRWAEKQAGPESIFNTPSFDFFLRIGDKVFE